MLNRRMLEAMARLFGGGEIVMPRGRSAVIDAFLASLSMEPWYADRVVELDALRGVSSDVDLDDAIERRRVENVLEWSTHIYLGIWCEESGVAWSPQYVLPSPEEAAEDAEQCALQAAVARSEVAPAPWDAAFEEAQRRAQLAQLRVRVPEAWEPMRPALYRAAWGCARVLAWRAGTRSMDDVREALRVPHERLRRASARQIEAMVSMQ